MRKLLACASLAVMLALSACSLVTNSYIYASDSEWPDSAEFSTLDSGQSRFSTHDTGLRNVLVLVDHQTGVEYLVTATGTCALVYPSGEPMRVTEAG